MSSKKTVKKVKKKNPNLRLVKNETISPEKSRAKSGNKIEKVRFGKSKRMVILLSMLALLLVSLVGAYIYIINNYTVTTVHVEGNIHYTNEEIMEMVMGGRYGNNSLLLSLKYRDKGINDVPFIETMDVTIEAKDTIRITVYEKALAGYVSYLGRYVYFDKDGIVVETSEDETQGIPQVTGLKFDHVILHEPLPVENPEVFEEVLNITQQLDKYGLSVDKIYFDADYQVTLIFGDARIALGDSRDIDEKIMKLQYILPDRWQEHGQSQHAVFDRRKVATENFYPCR